MCPENGWPNPKEKKALFDPVQVLLTEIVWIKSHYLRRWGELGASDAALRDVAGAAKIVAFHGRQKMREMAKLGCEEHVVNVSSCAKIVFIRRTREMNWCSHCSLAIMPES